MVENRDPDRVAMMRIDNGLYLPSIAMENFRGLKKLKMPELGQVTLLVGENNVAKSTVLEAMQLYAGAGSCRVMRRILTERDNIAGREGMDENGAAAVPSRARPVREDTGPDLDYSSLFFGFGEPEAGSAIAIGPADPSRKLKLRLSRLEAGDLEDIHPALLEERELNRLEVCMGSRELGRIPIAGAGTFPPRRAPAGFAWDADAAGAFTIDCRLPGGGLPSNAEVVPRYEDLLLTAGAEQLLDLLQSANGDIEALASMGDGRRESFPRRMFVKCRGAEGRIPLRSMGRGIVRLFGMAVTLLGAKGGLRLLDNMDNGIHHSRLQQVWDFVFRAAMSGNVQVVATTHSRDCVAGFARACREWAGKIRGALLRIDREGVHTWAVAYSMEGLLAATRAGIEVR